jgi:hypothetical protein
LTHSWARPGFARAPLFGSVGREFPCYTTIRYGDLVMPKPGRMLAPLEALPGILMCGISTVLFFAIVARWIGSWMLSRIASEPHSAAPMKK